MTFQVLITALPCNHIIIDYTTSTGMTGQIITSRNELINEAFDISVKDKAFVSLIGFIKEQRLAGRTWAQVKTDLEAKVFTI